MFMFSIATIIPHFKIWFENCDLLKQLLSYAMLYQIYQYKGKELECHYF